MIVSHSIQYTHSYTAFGLKIGTTFPIPELTVSALSSSEPDITISRGNIPPLSSDAIVVKQHAWTLANQAWLKINNVGRFWIYQGKEIIMDKAHGTNDVECRFYLLGAALACALVQRNILPLHGCSIVSGKKAILFLGKSGSGKSTLAARFQQLGYPILSDDVCAVNIKSATTPQLLVAYPQMKLGQTTLEFLGIPHDSQLLVKNRHRKNFFPLVQTGLEHSYPLERIYFLRQSPHAFIKSISKSDGLPQLITNTHRKLIVQSICGVKKHFQQCAHILNHVDTYCFARPHDFKQFHNSMMDKTDLATTTVLSPQQYPNNPFAV